MAAHEARKLLDFIFGEVAAQHGGGALAILVAKRKAKMCRKLVA